MFQTLILIASIVVLAGAILTSSLVSARDAFHREVAAKTQTAMTDATSQFVTWAQVIIANNGTEQNWLGAVNPAIPSKPMCLAAGPCQFFETPTWIVTGATIGQQIHNTGSRNSLAQNMSTAIDEQRLSASISVLISDATGRKLFGGRTQEITARLLDVAPYVIVTASHDLGSSIGRSSDSEGDTGGTTDVISAALSISAPDVAIPAAYVNTVIKTTIDCQNTATFDETNPYANADKGNGSIIKVRQGGALLWSYQLPCDPTYGVPKAPNGIKEYVAPLGVVYQINAAHNTSSWQKNDSGAAIPR